MEEGRRFRRHFIEKGSIGNDFAVDRGEQVQVVREKSLLPVRQLEEVEALRSA
jgi:hypothetical protein